MKSAKEALLAAGRVKAITRGRISRDNHDWLKAQYDSGERFRDWPKHESQVVSESDSGDKPKVVVAQRTEKVVQDFVIFFDERDYKAVGPNGKAIGMREVCNNCMVSLVQCHCDHPTILDSIPVRIVAK